MPITIDNFVGHPFMPMGYSTRQLNVHGIKSDNAIIEVYADNVLLDPVFDQNLYDPFFKELGTVLYSFKLPTKAGCIKIRIKVLQGEICLGKSRAKYPAKIINSKNEITYGHFYLWQPMQDSKFLVKVNNVISDLQSPLVAGDIVEYYHLFHKGIPYWVLTLVSDKSVTEVDVDDIHLSSSAHSDEDEVEIIKQELLKRNMG
jgi:hypothetical protein